MTTTTTTTTGDLTPSKLATTTLASAAKRVRSTLSLDSTTVGTRRSSLVQSPSMPLPPTPLATSTGPSSQPAGATKTTPPGRVPRAVRPHREAKGGRLLARQDIDGRREHHQHHVPRHLQSTRPPTVDRRAIKLHLPWNSPGPQGILTRQGLPTSDLRHPG